MTFSFFLIWVACIAIAPLYNLLGEKMILIGILLPILFQRKLIIVRKTVLCIVPFILFFAIKLLFAVDRYNAISYFHSVFTLALGILELALLFACIKSFDFSSVSALNVNRKRIYSFIVYSFYSSLVISIILMIIRGRDFYRADWSNGGILVAPNFYMLMSIVISMALTYEAIKNKKKRIVNGVLIVIGFIFILLANYATQLLFYLFGIILVCIFSLIDTTIKKIVGVFLLTILTVYSINQLPDFIYWINNRFFLQNPTMHMRLNEIYTLLRFGDAGRDLNGRFDLMNLSINTFREHWILGVPFSQYNTVYTGIIVGDHSEWVDDLARYGVIGSVFFAVFAISGIKTIFTEFKLNKTMMAAYTILIVLYGFANPIIKVFLMCGLVIASSLLACSEESRPE